MKDLEQLITDLDANEDLRTRLAAAGEDDDAANAIFAEEGYAVTAAEIKEYAVKKSEEDLGEETLRKVAGGISTEEEKSSSNGCAMVGAGYACWLK